MEDDLKDELEDLIGRVATQKGSLFPGMSMEAGMETIIDAMNGDMEGLDEWLVKARKLPAL